MSRAGDRADIESVLQGIGETGRLPEPYATDPGSLFLAIHDQWVKNGGSVAGKRRHSVQKLMEMLKAEGTPVASLRSKLNGETRLKDGDAAALLGVYFSRWRFETGDDEAELKYLPPEKVDSEKTSIVLLKFLLSDHRAVLLPKVERSQKDKAKSADSEIDNPDAFLAGRDVTSDNFRTSKAFIHVSRIGSVAGPTTATAIRAFCRIMDEYWEIDQEDKLGRILIWIVDPGDRDITNDDSLAAVTNAEQLATYFRAVRLLNDPLAQIRWQWLSSHAVVLVGSMDTFITDRLYSSESKKLKTAAMKNNAIPRGIKHGHFLLGATPPGWLRSSQFAQLYGHGLEELESSSFLLCLDDAETHWRYFGYVPAKTPIVAKDGNESFAKFLELSSPGPVFDQVASVVHAAACYRLGAQNPNINEEEQLRSLIILRHLDFAVFRLSEFLNAETLSRSSP